MIFEMVGGGSSGGLNFSVKGYASADALPASAKENTIAVITSTEVTSYVFSATEPESPEEGMVYFATSTSSLVEFNALKRDKLQVYPVSAQQYISGAWVKLEAKSYQNGAWIDWWDGTLFHNGNQYEGITGGWTGVDNNGSTATIGDTLVASYYYKATVFGASFHTNNAVDLTDYSTLYVRFTECSGRQTIYICSTNEFSDPAASNSVKLNAAGSISCDVSSLEGEYYIAIFNGGSEGSFTADKVWLE